MKATDILRSEHETILDVLAALESISRPSFPDEGLDLRSAQGKHSTSCVASGIAATTGRRSNSSSPPWPRAGSPARWARSP
jgi:hypothetical protein